MGLSFKENCADTRNSGILSVITTLKKLNCKLDLYDPWVNKKDIKEIYNIFPQTKLNQNTYDAVIIAVAHDKFKKMGAKAISNLCKKSHIIYDLKYLFLKNQTDLRM
jgi:UDP-N-acetyl-D-galactosamine dehydrogenase